MKARITRGSGFRGALNYVFDAIQKASGKKRPELISTNLPGNDAASFSAAFSAFKKLRPDITKPVWHSSLRLPAGERFTSEKWAEVVSAYLLKMGFDDATGYVVVRHNDQPDGDHVHVVLSRVNARGECWLGQHEVHRAIAATQQLEREFGLRLTPGFGDADDEAKATRPKRKADSQTVLNANRAKDQRRVDTAECSRLLLACAARSKDLPSFTVAAAELGFTIRPNRSKTTNYVSGLSVIPPGRKKFLPLGDATAKALTWPKLLKQFELNDAAAEAARQAARTVINTADARAMQVVEARLARQPEQVPHQPRVLRVLLPSAINLAKEAAMSTNLDFLNPPPAPRPPDVPLDDVELVVSAAEQGDRDRIERERAAATAAVEEELRSFSNTQLKRLRDALRGELKGQDAEAIRTMLARFTRLVVRLLSCGKVVLPPTESERRAHVARHSLKLIDAEVQRRADVCAQDQAAPELPRQQPVTAPLRIVRAHDARQNQNSQSSAERDADAEAKAQRESNRTS
jgi:Relaxase/Mobilisation nuclease domain